MYISSPCGDSQFFSMETVGVFPCFLHPEDTGTEFVGEKAEKCFFFHRKMFLVKNMIYMHTYIYIYIKYIQCNCNCSAKYGEVPPWVMYFWSFKQLSNNSCILVRLGQVVPDKPLATHIQAEASMFTVQRKKMYLCVWSRHCREGMGRKGSGG